MCFNSDLMVCHRMQRKEQNESRGKIRSDWRHSNSKPKTGAYPPKKITDGYIRSPQHTASHGIASEQSLHFLSKFWNHLLQESRSIGFGNGVVVKDLVVQGSSSIKLGCRCRRLGGSEPIGGGQEKED